VAEALGSRKVNRDALQSCKLVAPSGADNYRVMRQIEDVDPSPVEVGIFSDRLVLLRDLPFGRRITVSVTARNQAGESTAKEATIRLAVSPVPASVSVLVDESTHRDERSGEVHGAFAFVVDEYIQRDP
jgi:hypothetical protein